MFPQSESDVIARKPRAEFQAANLKGGTNPTKPLASPLVSHSSYVSYGGGSTCPKQVTSFMEIC